jgi:hypothetical protein
MIELDIDVFIHLDNDAVPFASTVDLTMMGYPLIRKMPLEVHVDVELTDMRTVRIKNLEDQRNLAHHECERKVMKINNEIKKLWTAN